MNSSIWRFPQNRKKLKISKRSKLKKKPIAIISLVGVCHTWYICSRGTNTEITKIYNTGAVHPWLECSIILRRRFCGSFYLFIINHIHFTQDFSGKMCKLSSLGVPPPLKITFTYSILKFHYGKI